MIFWKEAWLMRAEGSAERRPPDAPAPAAAPPVMPPDRTYACQATSLLAATQPLSRWDLSQYVRDVTSGNFTTLQEISALMIVLYNRISRWLGGREYGAAVGTLEKTPTVALGLQAGELVEVRSRDEIIATLDPWAKNRGLSITWEMLRHSGRRFRVLTRVDRMILETNGHMREIKNTVLLDGAACEGVCRRSCARYTHPMWREAWLKRVEEPAAK